MMNAQEIANCPAVREDLIRLVLGPFLGSGAARTVYRSLCDPTTVFKVEHASASFQNVKEWEFWNAQKGCKKVAKWLAPCVRISNCGTVLVQKYTGPLVGGSLPKKLPKFLADVKREHFGVYDGRVVCHDYGITRGIVSTKLQEVSWGSKDVG